MTIQNGIAIALAIIVVGVFFIYPRFSPFGGTPAGSSAAAPAVAATAPAETGQLQVLDEVVGTGATVQAGDQITVNYVGALSDGKVFDASANHGGPATFVIGVGQVIPGWDQGVIGMKEGGKRKLVIPASLAYGDQGVPNAIPGGATLTFEIELVKVTHPAK
jgi:FKBP-type peptidyl-prolyl cis-trans isomerase